MSAIRLRGATSGTTDVVAAAIAGDGVMTLPTGTGTLATTAFVNTAVAAGGKVLQVVSTTKTDTFSASVTNGASVAVTGLTAAITPRATSSKIMIFTHVNGSYASGNFMTVATIVKRDTTVVGAGAAAGSRTPNQGFTSAIAGGGNAGVTVGTSFLDSPSTTSQITYSVEVQNLQAGETRTVYVNRTHEDGNNSATNRSSSTITLMEIGA